MRVNTHKRGKGQAGPGSPAAGVTLDTKHPFATTWKAKAEHLDLWDAGGHSGSQYWEAQEQHSQGKSIVQFDQITPERAQYEGLTETKLEFQIAAFGHRGCLLWGTMECRYISSKHSGQLQGQGAKWDGSTRAGAACGAD